MGMINRFMLTEKRQEELSDLAEVIANKYCPNNLVEPKIIAESYKIGYNYGNYENYFDGLLEHEYNNFHIYINLDKVKHGHTPRARFTFAHELGHYFIDEHRIALMNGDTPSHPSFTNFSSKNPVELEADFFASSLLMPKNRLIKDCFKKKFSFNMIEELSSKYQTSITATLLKFASIGNHPLFIVCSIKGKIQWYKYSYDFPFKVINGYSELKNSSEDKLDVPEYTLAHDYFEDKTKYDDEQIVYAGDWFDNIWEKEYNRPFYEKCIYADSYGFVLSILWED